MKTKPEKIKKEVTLADLSAGLDVTHKMIDDLARSTAQGFLSVDDRLEKLDEKIDYHVTALTNKIDNIVYFGATREEHKTLERRVKKIEDAVL